MAWIVRQAPEYFKNASWTGSEKLDLDIFRATIVFPDETVHSVDSIGQSQVNGVFSSPDFTSKQSAIKFAGYYIIQAFITIFLSGQKVFS